MGLDELETTPPARLPQRDTSPTDRRISRSVDSFAFSARSTARAARSSATSASRRAIFSSGDSSQVERFDCRRPGRAPVVLAVPSPAVFLPVPGPRRSGPGFPGPPPDRPRCTSTSRPEWTGTSRRPADETPLSSFRRPQFWIISLPQQILDSACLRTRARPLRPSLRLGEHRNVVERILSVACRYRVC